MTRNGIPIHLHPLPRVANSNITIAQTDGEVPEYDCREAAIYSHYNWTEWEQLHYSERAMCIAQYRIHMLIEAHVNAAAQTESKRNARKKS